MRKKEKWYVAAKKADFAAIAANFGIDQVTARLIRNRGVIGMDAVQEYLHGDLSSLHAPEQMKGCREAAELLAEKIQEGKKIRIIGDYDIDGVCATYILYQALQACSGGAAASPEKESPSHLNGLLDGALIDYEIPDRMKDGYGLNKHLVEYAYEEGVDTILTCDNGISAIDEIAYAKEKGMTVIVTDHHEPLFLEDEDLKARSGSDKSDPARCVSMPWEKRVYRLPPADVIVNPHQPGCPYPYKKLCGAAVAWKVVCVLYALMGHSQEEAEELLTFAGFATVGDVMDLDGENRILVKEGLARLKKTKNLGLDALIRANDIDPKTLTSYHIGFVLGPCINASGRLDTAKLSLRLLLAKTQGEAEQLAAKLKELNDERKDLTQQATDEACALIESDESYQKDRVLVVYLPTCHESIAGIVAGRLRERYYKPTFVITDAAPVDDESALNMETHTSGSQVESNAAGEPNFARNDTYAESGIDSAGVTSTPDCGAKVAMAKGSGRSIEAYSMFEEMVKCQDLFTKFGGHPMAAGFSLERDRIPEMRRRLNENCTLTEDELAEKVSIDVAMPINYISSRLVEELSLLEPFGKGNEKPLFADTSLFVVSARVLGKNKNTVKMRVQNRQGYIMDALWFGDPEPLKSYLISKYGEKEVENLFWGRSNRVRLDLTYYPSINEYMGRTSLQIVVKNYR